MLTGHGMSLGHPLSNIAIAAVPIAKVPARPTTPGSSCRLPKAVAASRAPPPITTAFGSTPRQLLAQVRVLFSKSCGKFLLSFVAGILERLYLRRFEYFAVSLKAKENAQKAALGNLWLGAVPQV